MSIFEDTNPRELKDLLRQIHVTEAALPDFQRDFVWDPSATQELIVSIAQNYPAGSILRIRNTQNLFACREIQAAPELSNERPTFLILDGQQRLTSLYQAFYGVGDHRYFLNVRKLMEGNDIEECIFYSRANHRVARRYSQEDEQAKDLVLPLSMLKGGSGEFGRWTRKIARTLDDASRNEFEDKVSEIEEHWIKAIDDYKFPVVTLSDSTSADAVCTIFETLNRTGVKLSVYDLLTARFWPQNINLRQCWADAQRDYPIIEEFKIDPYYLLMVVSMTGSTRASCKRSDILSLTTEAFEERWPAAVKGMEKALEILRDDCGVLTLKWIPFNTMLVPLAAVLATHQPSSPESIASDRNKLARWFWCSVFNQTYDNAANSQSERDYNEINLWLNDGPPPQTVTNFSFDPAALREVTFKQRAVYKGIMCLILKNDSRDFHTGARINAHLMTEKGIDDHHIFPAAYLARLQHPKRIADCVLNRTLIDSYTNRRINDRAPSAYMGDILALQGQQGMDEILKSHYITTGSDSPLLKDNFEEFLSARQDTIFAKLMAVTGYHRPVQNPQSSDSNGLTVEEIA